MSGERRDAYARRKGGGPWRAGTIRHGERVFPLAAQEIEFAQQLAALQETIAAEAAPVEAVEVTPRRSDLEAESLALAWIPWLATASGESRPAGPL